MHGGAHVPPGVASVEVIAPALAADGAVAVDGEDAVVRHGRGLVQHTESDGDGKYVCVFVCVCVCVCVCV